jgi:hypothetical protein
MATTDLVAGASSSLPQTRAADTSLDDDDVFEVVVERSCF